MSLISEELLSVPGMGQPFEPGEGGVPLVLLMVGINGSGKTTSAGKLAAQFLKRGKRVVMAAADTFRAAAIEQLQVWGERAGVRVVAQSQGSDPAAVAFDAWQAARSSDADVLIVDTAGRLHAKHNLMESFARFTASSSGRQGASGFGPSSSWTPCWARTPWRRPRPSTRCCPSPPSS